MLRCLCRNGNYVVARLLNMNFKQQRVGDLGKAKCFQHFANTQTLYEMYRKGKKQGLYIISSKFREP